MIVALLIDPQAVLVHKITTLSTRMHVIFQHILREGNQNSLLRRVLQRQLLWRYMIYPLCPSELSTLLFADSIGTVFLRQQLCSFSFLRFSLSHVLKKKCKFFGLGITWHFLFQNARSLI